MVKEVKVSEILKKACLDQTIDDLIENSNDSQYFAYDVGRGVKVHVESTASQVMDELTKLDIYNQTRIFNAIAEELSEPGDSMIVINDKKDERKQRSAYVARLKGDDRNVYLLITR